MARRLIGCLLAVCLSGMLFGAPVAARGSGRDLKEEPFTVIAVVDSGIDPYHLDFRRPELRSHPSTYIEGFPRNAPALHLSFDQSHYGYARGADVDLWEDVEPNRLYWIPGTNIIGAIGPFDVDQPLGVEGPDPDEPPFFDEVGHGTPVASLAAGAIHGPDTDRTLIVAVKGFEEALEWAAGQPWIDVITNSWWNLEPSDYSVAARTTRQAVKRGKIVCFASGNFSHPQLYTGTQGPSWTVNVGAASERTRGEHYYTDYPNDVLGLSGLSAAAAGSFDEETDFAGTSAATPNVCGLAATIVSDLRAAVGDSRQGPTNGALVRGRGSGSLEDGRVTREEIEDALQATAVPAEPSTDTSDPDSIPALGPAAFVRGGYGIVDRRTARAATRVLLGSKPRPDRALEDAWLDVVDALRDAIWANLP